MSMREEGNSSEKKQEWNNYFLRLWNSNYLETNDQFVATSD